MRKRKRDWPVLVYKYRAYTDNLPEYVWQHIRQQNELWNKLVVVLEYTLAAWQELKKSDTDKESVKAFWDSFWADCQLLVDQFPLDWEARADILDHFRTSVQTAFKDKNREMPTKRHGVKAVRVTHRYTGGGLPADKIFGSRAKRFSILNHPSPDAYIDNSQRNRRRRVVDARFGVDGETFDFRLRLHRPFPAGAILKNVVWLGEYNFHPDPAQRWRWHVAMWLEIPPHQPIRPGCVAGLDLGWRKFDDYLRIGYLIDSDNRRIELRLPLDMSTNKTRRDGLPSTWEDKFALDEQQGRLVEDIKAEIKPMLNLLDLPAEIARSVGQLSKMRQSGLTRLRHALADVSGAQPIIDTLAAWQPGNDKLRYQSGKLARRLVARRRWLYGNLAAWLARNYNLVWEGKLDIKEMAEDSDKSPALSAADKYRQIAAIGELRQAIKNAYSKNGAVLHGGKTARTTSLCSICGASVEVTAALCLTCANGHTLDTDENAARNLISQMPAQIMAELDLRENRGKITAIPQELAGVAVILSNL